VRIAIGSDHSGFSLKEQLIDRLRDQGHLVTDFGAYGELPPVDYPIFAIPPAEAVSRGEAARAIVIEGMGIGGAIAANKVHGIRCAVCWNRETAALSRRHNNANVLSLGQRAVSVLVAFEIVDVWLATPFEGGAHARRVQELDCYEAGGGVKGMVAVFDRKMTL
jgi:ribose 5-phosphate isomerase B